MAIGRDKAERLTLEELEAQAGGLLPDRLEMRRRRRARRRSRLSLLAICANRGLECEVEVDPD